MKAVTPLLPPSGSEVVVALSGGVDSAVAALLLRDRGYVVSALFMDNWGRGQGEDGCRAREDYAAAAAVASHLGIELKTADFSEEYWRLVFAPFLDDCRAGLMPNPDVLCNPLIKFGVCLRQVLASGCQWLATGHYASVARFAGRYGLVAGIDEGKDQSYFLYRLSQSHLGHALMPLGQLRKSETRRLAREVGLPNSSRPDSTGLCFIGERDFRAFLQDYLPTSPGPICDLSGRVLGEHCGLWFYTIGQRRGLGIGGLEGEAGDPWYVVERRKDSNELIVDNGRDSHELQHRLIEIHDLSWCSGCPPAGPFRARARIRHRQPLASCEVAFDRSDPGRALVSFDESVWAAAAGQSLVLYNGSICLGGGLIARVIPAIDAESQRQRTSVSSDSFQSKERLGQPAL